MAPVAAAVAASRYGGPRRLGTSPQTLLAPALSPLPFQAPAASAPFLRHRLSSFSSRLFFASLFGLSVPLFNLSVPLFGHVRSNKDLLFGLIYVRSDLCLVLIGRTKGLYSIYHQGRTKGLYSISQGRTESKAEQRPLFDLSGSNEGTWKEGK